MISYYLDLTFVYLRDNMSNIITHNIYSFVESMNSLHNHRFSPQSILNAYLLFDVLGANVWFQLQNLWLLSLGSSDGFKQKEFF